MVIRTTYSIFSLSRSKILEAEKDSDNTIYSLKAVRDKFDSMEEALKDMKEEWMDTYRYKELVILPVYSVSKD